MTEEKHWPDSTVKPSMQCPLCFPHLIPLPEDENDRMVEVTALEDDTFKAICRTHGGFSWNYVTQRWEKERRQ